jgi:L-alanine-DL-glutamate epimerase-like enolase superfamily enzyme
LEGCRIALASVDWERVGEIDSQKSPVAELKRISAQVSALTPAARFCIEAALLDLIGKHRRQPAYRLINNKSRHTKAIPVSALLNSETPKAALEAARRALAQGIRTFKVKLRRASASEWNFDILKTLRRELGDDVELRADANGAFAPDEAPSLLHRLAQFRLEFVEEPTHLESMRSWTSAPVPLALDESLQSASHWRAAEALIRRGVCQYVILKPAALGGLTGALEVANWASALGARTVVTHMWDGPMGFAANATLALAVQSSGIACGLARHSGLEAWAGWRLPFLTGNAVIPTDMPGLGITSSGEATS